jgi:hypothetical protein
MFHYYPTYYYLHVHFVHAEMKERVGAYCAKSVLLEDVIDHLEMDGDYFKKKTMIVQIGEQHPMFKILNKNGLIKSAEQVKQENTQAST